MWRPIRFRPGMWGCCGMWGVDAEGPVRGPRCRGVRMSAPLCPGPRVIAMVRGTSRIAGVGAGRAAAEGSGRGMQACTYVSVCMRGGGGLVGAGEGCFGVGDRAGRRWACCFSGRFKFAVVGPAYGY